MLRKCNYIVIYRRHRWNRYSLRARLPTVYHTVEALNCPFRKRQTGRLRISILAVFGLTGLGIEFEFTVSEADALLTRSLIGLKPHVNIIPFDTISVNFNFEYYTDSKA